MDIPKTKSEFMPTTPNELQEIVALSTISYLMQTEKPANAIFKSSAILLDLDKRIGGLQFPITKLVFQEMFDAQVRLKEEYKDVSKIDFKDAEVNRLLSDHVNSPSVRMLIATAPNKVNDMAVEPDNNQIVFWSSLTKDNPKARELETKTQEILKVNNIPEDKQQEVRGAIYKQVSASANATQEATRDILKSFYNEWQHASKVEMFVRNHGGVLCGNNDCNVKATLSTVESVDPSKVFNGFVPAQQGTPTKN